MMKLRTIGAAAAASVLLFPLSASTATTDDAARAAGKNWGTIRTMEGALHQACRVSVDNGAKWRVFNRVDARRADWRSSAYMEVLHNGVGTGAKWDSGRVRPGTISDVGSVLLPRKPGYKLREGGGTKLGGSSSVIKVASLNRC